MRLFRNKNFWIILLFDILLLSFCYYGAYWLRFDGQLSKGIWQQFSKTLLPLLFCKLASFYFFDLYRGMWRYTGIKDLLNLVKGTIAGSLLFVLYLVMEYHFAGFSRSIIVIDGVFTLVALGGIRLLIRLYYQRDPHFFEEIMFWHSAVRDNKKILIVGTGDLAERLLREIFGNSKLNYKVIGFVEKESSCFGMKIHGVPILGVLDDIPDLVDFYGIDDVFIADAHMSASKIKKLIELCTGRDVRFKVIPSLSERINGYISDHLRDLRVEDLLAREPIRIDMDMVKKEIEGTKVLVTGAGGSIGSELARQILEYHPLELILLDNAETSLYHIDLELSQKKTTTRIIPSIGDIRSHKGLDRIFKQYRPDFVYHAAAYKHVPLMEMTPLDAVNNNIIGTYKLASVACKYHVKEFVMISTDKAVHPSSIMGVTKRVAEMVAQSMNGNGTRFVVVRFGNVLGSNGSVVPLFEKQIASGGPVTVTHPEVTRFFMTIPEAVMLVLQAGSIGKGGELFLLDMGESVKIIDLARNMIRLAGLVPDRDIKIKFVGLRPGEKLKEELLIAGENVVNTAYDKIKICNNANNIDEAKLYKCIEHFNVLVKDSGDQNSVVGILKELVPAYKEHIDEHDQPKKDSIIQPQKASAVHPVEIKTEQ